MIDFAGPLRAIAFTLEMLVDQRAKGRLAGDGEALQRAIARQRESFFVVRTSAVVAVTELGGDTAVVRNSRDVFSAHATGKKHGVSVFRCRLCRQRPSGQQKNAPLDA